MNEKSKKALYKRICKALDRHVKAFGEYAEADELFVVLDEIRNNWDDLTE